MTHQNAIKYGSANVIMTFENPGFDGARQMFFDVDLSFLLPDMTSEKEKTYFEVDVIRQVIAYAIVENQPCGFDFSKLAKISLCYGGEICSMEDQQYVDYLVRNDAKYYFQPNQRDEFEELLVHLLNIGTHTSNIE